MDESVELFAAEQRRLAEQGGPIPALRSHIMTWVLRLGTSAIIMFVLLTVLDRFPRNSDHSMKVVYYGPVLAILGIGSIMLLRRPAFRQSPFAMAAWLLVLMAIAAIPAGMIDLLLRSGS